MTDIYTRKHFCGHWSDDDLARGKTFLLSQKRRVMRDLSELARDIAWIELEQKERIENTGGAV